MTKQTPCIGDIFSFEDRVGWTDTA